MTVHTFPVPNGCTIEFAWQLHCAGVPFNATYGEGWVNLEIDDTTHAILHVYTDDDEREARKEMMAHGPQAPDTHIEHASGG